jgi:hypothetical protein
MEADIQSSSERTSPPIQPARRGVAALRGVVGGFVGAAGTRTEF